uniref:Uncharacterized protein n=1 Tax=Tanacetum cinerariifolium TaxID=118510 RepID=A0A699IKK6_TANCI|nr:hypothetical protein [Tanacetum cinerariifolium]
MAFGIICLATNQKFNFSNYIFDNMVKHLDGGVKFMMYPRFVQVFLDNQVEGMNKHNAIFIISSYIKKVFVNMKREGKDFSRKVTPLFQSMMVQAPEDIGGNGGKKLKFLHQVVRFLMRKVIDLEEAKTTQAKEIASLEKRVKILEQKRKSRTLGLKRLRKVRSARRVESSSEASLGDQEDASKQGRMIDNIDHDVEITLVDKTSRRMNKEDVFRVNNLDGDETLIEIKAAKPKSITTIITTVTAAGIKPKEKRIVMQEPSETPSPKPIDSFQKPSQAKDKGKEKMVEPKRPLKRKYQIMMDAEVAKNLKAHMQAKLEEEEERLARLKEEETNIALIKLWDNTQAMMDADCELAARLQEEEKGELSIGEKSRLFVKLIDKRKKHFARLRAEKIKSKPPTKAQKRNQMCTYLKNMANYKHNQLKNKSFIEIQMLFNNTIKWIEAFVPMDTELVKGELKRCLEIILEDDDDVIIKATPLSSKSPTIVNYTIHKEGKKSFFKIIRADGNSQNYLTFGKMFKNYNKEDLEVLWSIVKARFKKTKPIDDMDNLLFQTLKTMLLDNDGNPLIPTGIVESDSEVDVVFDETTNLRILTSGKDGSDKGYGTNILLEQLRDSYPDNDDYDPYDDDMYENHDMSEHLQSICDDLDITIRGRMKK